MRDIRTRPQPPNLCGTEWYMRDKFDPIFCALFKINFLLLFFIFSAPQAKFLNILCSKNEICFVFGRFECGFYPEISPIPQRYAGQRYAGQDLSLPIYVGHPACPAYFMQDKETMNWSPPQAPEAGNQYSSITNPHSQINSAGRTKVNIVVHVNQWIIKSLHSDFSTFF